MVKDIRERAYNREREGFYTIAKIDYDDGIIENRIKGYPLNDAEKIKKLKESSEILKQLSNNAKIQKDRYGDLLTYSISVEHEVIINNILDYLELIEKKLRGLLKEADHNNNSIRKVENEERKRLPLIKRFASVFMKKTNSKDTTTLEELERKYYILNRVRVLSLCKIHLIQDKDKGSNRRRTRIGSELSNLINKMIAFNEEEYDNEKAGILIDEYDKVFSKFNKKTFQLLPRISSPSPRTSSPSPRVSPSSSRTSSSSSSGGSVSKPIKKEVCGKLRCIYKIPGSRKEHLKYKGRLITVADYKRLMKA